jgi:hypothetical protein
MHYCVLHFTLCISISGRITLDRPYVYPKNGQGAYMPLFNNPIKVLNHVGTLGGFRVNLANSFASTSRMPDSGPRRLPSKILARYNILQGQTMVDRPSVLQTLEEYYTLDTSVANEEGATEHRGEDRDGGLPSQSPPPAVQQGGADPGFQVSMASATPRSPSFSTPIEVVPDSVDANCPQVQVADVPLTVALYRPSQPYALSNLQSQVTPVVTEAPVQLSMLD